MRFVLTIYCLLGCYILMAADTLYLQSPGKKIQAKLYVQQGALIYAVTAKGKEVIEPSHLGMRVNDTVYGKQVTLMQLQKQQEIRTTASTQLNSTQYTNHCIAYSIRIQEKAIKYTIEYRLFDNGCAFRYLLPRNQHHVQEEYTTFTIPTKTTVWYFERDSDWKLKSYAGLWQQTGIEQLPVVSLQGPIQGKPLVMELPDHRYTLITEAALYQYSGMRLKANGSRVLQVNFTEGNNGFTVADALITPWRVILYAGDLNALVNNHIIEALNPAPDKTLYSNTDYIQPGKSVWSWITRGDNYMQPEEEKKFIDAAASLNIQYTLLDEGWETVWNNKWQQLKEICTYAASKGVRVWVWKHSKDLREPESRDAFLDSVQQAGAAGVKTDFMNSEAAPLIDFETSLLKSAARRKLMINFHGCQAPTGESATYPNEMTREGVRGMELNIMKEPIPAWHNAALPFTRFICGHGDYTPALFSNKGKTTYTHQLALLYLFNSPFQCIAENPMMLLNDKKYTTILPLLKTLPVTWDETIVLPGSSIGKMAAFARRKGNDWYVAVINGTEHEKTFTLHPVFLTKGMVYSGTRITDAVNDAGFVMETIRYHRSEQQSFSIPATGGMVIAFKRI